MPNNQTNEKTIDKTMTNSCFCTVRRIAFLPALEAPKTAILASKMAHLAPKMANLVPKMANLEPKRANLGRAGAQSVRAGAQSGCALHAGVQSGRA